MYSVKSTLSCSVSFTKVKKHKKVIAKFRNLGLKNMFSRWRILQHCQVKFLYMLCYVKNFWNYLHSTLGKQGGGSSEHSGLLIRQALHSCNALASNMVSCFWMFTSALSFLRASINSCKVWIRIRSASSKLKIGISPRR